MSRSVLRILITGILMLSLRLLAAGQCSMCTKTAQQLGEKPALGLNQGIIYLMLTPFAVMGFIAYRWWKSNRNSV